jgi:hypothetical protein
LTNDYAKESVKKAKMVNAIKTPQADILLPVLKNLATFYFPVILYSTKHIII